MFIVYCYMFNEWGLFPFGIVLFLKLSFFPLVFGCKGT